MTRVALWLAWLLLPAALVAAPSAPIFRDVASEVGLNFHHVTGATGQYFMPEIMGAGAALLDYDNDGDLDVYLVQGRSLESGRASPTSSSQLPTANVASPGNRLFRNMLAETGTLRFEDVTEKAGAAYDGYGMGAATGDYDNDGFLDLYVTNVGGNVLFHNNGNGTFTDATREAGVAVGAWSTSASFLDYDNDGLLDLFVGNYVDFTVQGNKRCFAPTGEPDYCTPMAYKAVPSRLFHNLGKGKFADVTEASGIGTSYGPALGIVAADLNGDGRTDIYVANDTAANRLWLNQGDGTFKESALEAGVAYDANGRIKAGMGVTAEEVDDQRTIAMLVTNLTREGATLFRGAKGAFEDVSSQYGVGAPTFGFTGFGAQWLDYDNDGRLDLFIANGAVTILESQRGTPYPFRQHSQLFHGEAAGQKFRETTSEAGDALQQLEVSRGVAVGDVDNDGAVDVLVTNNNGPVRLLRNVVAPQQHWLEVRLEGVKANRCGIGARVGVLRDGEETIWRRVHTDSSYLSAGDVRVHFGLRNNPRIRAVMVEWPGGSHERWENIQADRLITLKQGSGQLK
jgi:enediyne biosynthesis protein E4